MPSQLQELVYPHGKGSVDSEIRGPTLGLGSS